MLHLQVCCLKSCWSHHLQVNIANQEYAKYVENHVPGYLWKAFVTQDTHDRDLLQQNLQGMGVPIINARDTNNLRAPSVTPQVKQVDFTWMHSQILMSLNLASSEAQTFDEFISSVICPFLNMNRGGPANILTFHS
jgi:hypothetical protein